MNTAFGILNNNVSEITDWHQLLSLKSKFDNVACAVTSISDDICRGTNITIYNKVSNINYITFFVSSTNSSAVDMSNLVCSIEDAERIVNLFGYSIRFIDKYNISLDTKELLTSFLNLGFNFIYKVNSEHIYVTRDNRRRLLNGRYLDVRESPNYKNCDFSFLNTNDIHSISNLLAESA